MPKSESNEKSSALDYFLSWWGDQVTPQEFKLLDEYQDALIRGYPRTIGFDTLLSPKALLMKSRRILAACSGAILGLGTYFHNPDFIIHSIGILAIPSIAVLGLNLMIDKLIQQSRQSLN